MILRSCALTLKPLPSTSDTKISESNSVVSGHGGISPDPGGLPSGAFSLPELIAVLAENYKWLLIGPLLAGVLAFGIISLLPKWYTSVAYLRINDTAARSADAVMRSSPVLDKVLAAFQVPGDNVEARRQYLDTKRRIVVAPNEIQNSAGLFRLEVLSKDPRAAQGINALFISAWLDSTRPPPNMRSRIEAEIERAQLQTNSISELLERLRKESPSLLVQNSLQGEIATPLVALITKRDQNLATIIDLRNQLLGTSTDVVFGPPDLPEASTWPKRGIMTILVVASTALLLFMFVILRRFIVPRFAKSN
jgi:hypothetical protein